MTESQIPEQPDNKPADTVDNLSTTTHEDEKQYTKKLGIKEFVFTLIIIVLVWIGKRIFGADTPP